MKFSYTAKTQRGDVQTGVIEAGSRETAVSTLQGYGFIVMRLEEEVIVPWQEKILSFFQRVRVQELAMFTRQFATLLEAQVPLTDALRTLFTQTRNTFLKESIFDVLSDVEGGAALSQTFEKHAKVFSQFYVQMVRSAEITGRLQEVFVYLADYLESQAKLNSRVKSAMIYPVFIFGLFAVVVGVMVVFVIPQLGTIFEEVDVDFSQLPFATRILFSLGDFAPKYGVSFLVMILVGGFVFREYFSSDEGRNVLDLALFRVPIVGGLARKIYLTRFAETTSVMISGDIPIAQSLEIAADVVGNIRYQTILKGSADAIRRGELVSESLSRYPEDFPPIVTQMIAVGEKTGRLDELLRRVAQFHASEIERAMANLTELLQPIMIVILGVFVGLLIGAIILPLYRLAQAF
ncbi:MAG: type II secretion system F family protein [Parcubacteria group bacterium]|nr:type II secretion system F family protein [Parcubacteria group bacterium]